MRQSRVADAYFSSRLIYAVPVDGLKVIFAARAWNTAQVQLKDLDGLVTGVLRQEKLCLPKDIRVAIRSAFRQVAVTDVKHPVDGLHWLFRGERNTKNSNAFRITEYIDNDDIGSSVHSGNEDESDRLDDYNSSEEWDYDSEQRDIESFTNHWLDSGQLRQ